MVGERKIHKILYALDRYWLFLKHSPLLVGRWVGLFLCLILLGSTLRAQEGRTVRGFVHSGQQALTGASVVLLSPQDSSVLAYTYTDDKGKFNINTDDKPERVVISIRCMGYKAYQQRLVLHTSQDLDVGLKEDATQLTELVVRAPTVWGQRDTINYSVQRISRMGDRSIGDVIRHIPGIRIQGDKIEYQGKPLKQINIDGVDLSQGDYSLLTNNIDAVDVATIQILDNHQSIKSLVGKRSSDDVVINLKLSPKKRGVWGASLDLGAGYGAKPETSTRLRTNYFIRSSQWLGVAYVDNSGRLDYQRMGAVTRANYPEEPSVFARVDKPSTPNLPLSYYIDNISALARGNSAFSFGDSSQLHLQGSYRYDRIATEASSLTSYESDTTPISLDERVNHQQKQHQVLAGASYEKNLHRYYIKDRLTLSLSKYHSLGGVRLNKELYPQSSNLDAVRLTNQLHYIHTKSRLPIELTVSQQLYRTREDFTASYTYLGRILPLPYSGQELTQRGEQMQFLSDNRILIPSIQLVRYVQYRPQLYLSYQYQKLSSGLLAGDNSGYDHMWRIGFEQSLSYLRRGQFVEISIPLVYQRRCTNFEALGGLGFEPRLKAKLYLGEHWGADLWGRYTHSEPNIKMWYPYEVLKDYRTLTKSTPRLYRENLVVVGGQLNYRDIFSFFTSSLRLNYSITYKPFIQMLRFDTAIVHQELLPHRHNTQTASVLWSSSKGFSWRGLGLDLDLGYTLHSGIEAYQGRISPYTHRTTSTRLALKSNPIRSMVLDYSLYYGHSRIKRMDKLSSADEQLMQTIKLGYSLSKQLSCDIIAEYSYISHKGEGTQVVILNSELSWRLRQVELSCELNNLLDVRHYYAMRRLSYATIQQSYGLRPRSILFRISFKL